MTSNNKEGANVQAEIIAALIGAAATLPAVGAAYVVGQRAASATLSAAHTQAEANYKQWRDNGRRSTWLAFVRSADEIDNSTDKLIRGDLTYGPSFQGAVSNFYGKLADLEFEGPAQVFDLGKTFHGRIIGRLFAATAVGPFIATQQKFDRALAQAQGEVALSGEDEASAEAICIREAHSALQALAAERGAIAAATPSEELADRTMAVLSPAFQGRALNEGMMMILQGFAHVMASIISSAPALVSDAEQKLSNCQSLNQGDAGGLIFNYATGALPIFERQLREAKEAIRVSRTDFLRKVDEYFNE